MAIPPHRPLGMNSLECQLAEGEVSLGMHGEVQGIRF